MKEALMFTIEVSSPLFDVLSDFSWPFTAAYEED